MEVRFFVFERRKVMAVNGVGTGYAYQNDTHRKAKKVAGNHFYEEISAAAKQMQEPDKENKQYLTGQNSMEIMERFEQASKTAKNRDKSGDTEKKQNESLSTEKMMQMIKEKMEELYEKIKKGETEQSFQIGASSFTIKEWEKFMEKFDESEEEVEKLIKEARDMQLKAAEKKEAAEKDNEEDGVTTEIIVKPDGSKVLVITMNFAGIETTMTVQISEPDEMQDEGNGQEAEGEAEDLAIGEEAES
ncbi:MAG: hypothetical protein J6C64_02975 [Lachnospiraceae bacterium]|nr:hypothetical protein [Lachnospiraceae bacterium]